MSVEEIFQTMRELGGLKTVGDAVNYIAAKVK